MSAQAMYEAARALADRFHQLSKGRERPVAVVVPVPPGQKKPMVVHMDGSWTEAASREWFENNRKHMKYDVGILMYGLFAIDFDKHEQYGEWAAQHPELESAPAERTKNGMHVYFQRCAAVEAARLFNGEMKDLSTGAKACIDRKTITKTGTGGLIVCAPSTNKEWLPGRSILELDPPVMSAGLLQKVVAYSSTKRKGEGNGAGGTKKANKQSDAPVVGPGPCADIWAPERDFKSLLKVFDFPIRPYTIQQNGTKFHNFEEWMQVDEFFARAAKDYVCHMCRKTHSDRLKGRVKLVDGYYRLEVQHFRFPDINCCKTFVLGDAAVAKYIADFAERPQLPSVQVADLVTACVRAGMYFRDPSSPPSVWRLDDPSPGWVAHAVLEEPGSPWRLLLQPPDGVGAWRRQTKLPGIFYEFLDEAAWTPSNPPAETKPPFWCRS